MFKISKILKNKLLLLSILIILAIIAFYYYYAIGNEFFIDAKEPSPILSFVIRPQPEPQVAQ